MKRTVGRFAFWMVGACWLAAPLKAESHLQDSARSLAGRLGQRYLAVASTRPVLGLEPIVLAQQNPEDLRRYEFEITLRRELSEYKGLSLMVDSSASRPLLRVRVMQTPERFVAYATIVSPKKGEVMVAETETFDLIVRSTESAPAVVLSTSPVSVSAAVASSSSVPSVAKDDASRWLATAHFARALGTLGGGFGVSYRPGLWNGDWEFDGEFSMHRNSVVGRAYQYNTTMFPSPVIGAFDARTDVSVKILRFKVARRFDLDKIFKRPGGELGRWSFIAGMGVASYFVDVYENGDGIVYSSYQYSIQRTHADIELAVRRAIKERWEIQFFFVNPLKTATTGRFATEYSDRNGGLRAAYRFR